MFNQLTSLRKRLILPYRILTITSGPNPEEVGLIPTRATNKMK
nr:MAG TPA: hypothetical protein [Caudoviricetes sp.]